jgi:hypothetical protein
VLSPCCWMRYRLRSFASAAYSNLPLDYARQRGARASASLMLIAFCAAQRRRLGLRYRCDCWTPSKRRHRTAGLPHCLLGGLISKLPLEAEGTWNPRTMHPPREQSPSWDPAANETISEDEAINRDEVSY